MIFGNPLPGTLRPSTWIRPPGNSDFRVTQVYGCTGVAAEPPYGTCAHFHRGIDLGNGTCGADVLAAAAGTVTLAGADPLSGNALRVVIAHPGGWFSLYYHLADIGVRVGQVVAPRQILGHVGKTGWATACHLHFEVHATSNRLSFFDPWPHLAQNVTVRPSGAGVNIRSSQGAGSILGPAFAISGSDGRIHRLSDGADLGDTLRARPWGGSVTGATYTIGGRSGSTWQRISLDGAWRFIASPLAVRSAT